MDENNDIILGSFYDDNNDSSTGFPTNNIYNETRDEEIENNNFNDDSNFDDFVNSFLQWYDENSGDASTLSLTPSTSSYLSTTQLDLFDRILDGGDYRYYIGYRTGSDSYGAVLYACDEVNISGNTITLISPMQFQLYRTYSGNTYYYYFTHNQLANDTVSINNNILYYTNIMPGYPLLAKQSNNDIKFSKDNLILIGVVLLILIVILGRRRKRV